MELKMSVIGLLLFALVSANASRPVHKNWWNQGLFYQIYIRSYMDSDGDGIGDIQGIIQKIQHLKNIGVTTAWLTPIFKSPHVDAGYDTSDYKAIHEEYGTMEDFEQLIAKAKEIGIKLLLDLVPNHTSDQHEWFIKSENREPGYEDYYVWVDGTDEGKTPPNNWISVFKFSSWSWSKVRKQWFLHQFTTQQPDLNYYNPKVIEEFENIMRFWLDKGIDGFRVDAVPYLIETGMEDEPLSGDPNAADYDCDYLIHTYTRSQPGSFEVVYKFRDFINKYNEEHPENDERIMVTEAYANITDTMKYYGDGDREGAHFTFNYELVDVDINFTARDLVMQINRWMDNMPKKYTANWGLGNHDNARVATKMGPKNADGYNMLIAILPGIATTYQGEEIGLENGLVSWDQGQDPAACNGRPEDFPGKTRDFERTPFHWNGDKNAGFSTADETWLPVSEKYLENNLERQIGDKNSHYELFRRVIGLRQEYQALKDGGIEAKAIGKDVMVIRRRGETESIVFTFNISEKHKVVDLKTTHADLPDEMTILMTNFDRTEGTMLNTTNLKLKPHQFIIAIYLHYNEYCYVDSSPFQFIY